MNDQRFATVRAVWPGPGAGLALAAVSLPACALLASRGVVVVFALAVALCLWRMAKTGARSGTGAGAGKPAGLLRSPLAILLAGVAVWAGLSLLWTLEPGAAAAKWMTTVTLLGGALVLVGAARLCDPRARAAVGAASVAGVLAGVGLLAAELSTGQKFTTGLRAFFAPDSLPPVPEALNQGACVLAIAVWPAVMVLWRDRRPVLALLLVGAVFSVVSVTAGSAAPLAIPIALAGGAAVWWGGRRAVRILSAALALLVAVAPALPLTLISPARLAGVLPGAALPELHRLQLWEFTARRILERPLEGWGFFASRFMPGGGAELIPGVPLMALHPHNAALQAWLELGLPGAALLAALLVVLLNNRRLSGAGPVVRAGLCATVLAGLTVASLSYGLWQSWWIAALCLVGAAASAAAGPEDSRKTGPENGSL